MSLHLSALNLKLLEKGAFRYLIQFKRTPQYDNRTDMKLSGYFANSCTANLRLPVLGREELTFGHKYLYSYLVANFLNFHVNIFRRNSFLKIGYSTLTNP